MNCLLLLGNPWCSRYAEGSSNSSSWWQNSRWWNYPDPHLWPQHHLRQILSNATAVVIRLWWGCTLWILLPRTVERLIFYCWNLYELMESLRESSQNCCWKNTIILVDKKNHVSWMWEFMAWKIIYVSNSSLGVVHKERLKWGEREGWLRCGQGGEGFDCMRMSATQYGTKAFRACVYLLGISCHLHSDGSGCIKWMAQVAWRLPSVVPWSVAWSPCIS